MLAGVVVDVVKGMVDHCDNLEIVTVQTQWDKCWTDGRIGEGLIEGWFHGCMSYTHIKGVRNRYVEFTEPILLKGAAGILTRLDANGDPVVSP